MSLDRLLRLQSDWADECVRGSVRFREISVKWENWCEIRSLVEFKRHNDTTSIPRLQIRHQICQKPKWVHRKRICLNFLFVLLFVVDTLLLPFAFQHLTKSINNLQRDSFDVSAVRCGRNQIYKIVFSPSENSTDTWLMPVDRHSTQQRRENERLKDDTFCKLWLLSEWKMSNRTSIYFIFFHLESMANQPHSQRASPTFLHRRINTSSGEQQWPLTLLCFDFVETKQKIDDGKT